MKLKAKVAFISGGGGGIGRAIALSLGQKKVAVAVADLNEKSAAEVADEIKKNGAPALGLGVDVTQKTKVRSAIETVSDRLGPIDILVNCAGIYPNSSVEEMAEEEWDQVFAVNIKANFLACQAVIPSMRKRKFGKIINISSGHGFKGSSKTAHYSATKAGLVVFTKSLALELAADGINVNCIAPGITDTDMPHRVMSDGNIQARAAQNPMGRIGTPQDVADTLLFLVSEESGYITGQTIYVNGGDLMPS
jgi:NAD(P)-dependent dehydrogenase (short-subunit alcohol dehydrogenase family)